MLFDGNEEDSEQDCSNVGDDVGGAGQHQQHAGRTREEDRNAASLRPKLGENEELLVIQAPAGWLGVVIGTCVCARLLRLV